MKTIAVYLGLSRGTDFESVDELPLGYRIVIWALVGVVIGGLIGVLIPLWR